MDASSPRRRTTRSTWRSTRFGWTRLTSAFSLLEYFPNSNTVASPTPTTANPASVNIVTALEGMSRAFTQRFGNGSLVLPTGTPFGNAREGFGRQPLGFTRYQVLATLLDPRTGVSLAYGVPEGEKEAAWKNLAAYALEAGGGHR
jgi:hypothetical protein